MIAAQAGFRFVAGCFVGDGLGFACADFIERFLDVIAEDKVRCALV